MPFDANYKSNNNNNNNNNKQLGLDLQKGVYSSLTFKKKIQKTWPKGLLSSQESLRLQLQFYSTSLFFL